MVNKKDGNVARLKRHTRVRGKIAGTAERPRLNVFRSLNHIYAQLIDDDKGATLVTASSVEKGFAPQGDTEGKTAAAKKVGETLAERAVKAGISDVVFDRGGYLYHGRVKELAEGARAGGLHF